jgi:hypothetical protein
MYSTKEIAMLTGATDDRVKTVIHNNFFKKSGDRDGTPIYSQEVLDQVMARTKQQAWVMK